MRHGGEPRIVCKGCGRRYMTINARNQHFYKECGALAQASSSVGPSNVGMGESSASAAAVCHDE
jgi:hypothetical protein